MSACFMDIKAIRVCVLSTSSYKILYGISNIVILLFLIITIINSIVVIIIIMTIIIIIYCYWDNAIIIGSAECPLNQLHQIRWRNLVP